MLSHFLLPWPNRSMRRRCSRLLEDILHWALKCEQKDWKVFEEANYWVTVPKKKKKALRILTKKKQLWERLFGETNLGEKDFLEFHSWDGGLEVSGTAIFIDPQGHWLNKLGTWDGKDPGIFWDKTQPINGWGTAKRVCTLMHHKMADSSQGLHYNSKDPWYNIYGWATSPLSPMRRHYWAPNNVPSSPPDHRQAQV